MAKIPDTATIQGPNTITDGEFCPPPNDAKGQPFTSEAARIAIWFRTWNEAVEFYNSLSSHE